MATSNDSMLPLEGIATQLADAENNASLIAIDVDHAARILVALAEKEGGSPVDDDCDEGWRQVHYIARQLQRHVKDMNAEWDRVSDGAANALRQMAGAVAGPPASVG